MNTIDKIIEEYKKTVFWSWELLLVLNKLKPAVLFQCKQKCKQSDYIVEKLCESLVENNEDFGFIDSNLFANKEWAKKIKNSNTNRDLLLGELLGYETPGDHEKHNKTRVIFYLISSDFYKQNFEKRSKINITSFVCQSQRLKNVKNNINLYAKKLATFFDNLGLGTIIVEYTKKYEFPIIYRKKLNGSRRKSETDKGVFLSNSLFDSLSRIKPTISEFNRYPESFYFREKVLNNLKYLDLDTKK
jgi:hypothetical protein